jgi:hypothetical protein
VEEAVPDIAVNVLASFPARVALLVLALPNLHKIRHFAGMQFLSSGTPVTPASLLLV